MHAQRLAATVAQRGELAIAGGDWNCYAPADQITPGALSSLPLRLRPARMHVRPGQLTPNHDVHNTLAATRLTDVAAGLNPGRRGPV